MRKLTHVWGANQNGRHVVNKVLYIVGAPRSGTTILGESLGSSSEMEHIGELNYLWDKNHPAAGECGCGTNLTDCPVWGRVLLNLSRAGVSRFETNGLRLNSWRMRQIPWRMRDIDSNRVANEYPALLGSIYGWVSEYSRVEVVIDSTKLPGDALAASVAPGTDTHILHVVRDPRAAAYSRLVRTKDYGRAASGSTMRRRGSLSSTRDWLGINAITYALVRRAVARDRFRELRYEDLMDQPHQVLRAICTWLDVDPRSLPLRGSRNVELGTTHTVMGNPNRFRTGVVELKTDEEWKTHLGTRDRISSALAASPILRHYGYPLRRV